MTSLRIKFFTGQRPIAIKKRLPSTVSFICGESSAATLSGTAGSAACILPRIFPCFFAFRALVFIGTDLPVILIQIRIRGNKFPFRRCFQFLRRIRIAGEDHRLIEREIEFLLKMPTFRTSKQIPPYIDRDSGPGFEQLLPLRPVYPFPDRRHNLLIFPWKFLVLYRCYSVSLTV